MLIRRTRPRCEENVLVSACDVEIDVVVTVAGTFERIDVSSVVVVVVVVEITVVAMLLDESVISNVGVRFLFFAKSNTIVGGSAGLCMSRV